MGTARAGRHARAALGLALAALAAPAALADVGTPIVSGLAWRSGATGGGFPCLARLRGRPLDAGTVFLTHASFPAMVRQAAGGWARGTAARAPLWVVSVPLLTDDTRGQFAQCAGGAFDGYWRQIGADLKAAGAQGTVVRLGWEANIGSDNHPWGVDSPGEVPAYKACWRRAAAQLRAGGPGIDVEWTNAKKTADTALHVLEMYPGDDAVDLWGVHYYDSGPEKATQQLWDEYYAATYNGGPWGLGTWLAAARQHGKRLGIAEWGVKRLPGQTAAEADGPVYVDNMYRFFRDNAESIAYETYFDAMPDQHALCDAGGTPTLFPNAAARYRADWGAGR
jgi:hypothetical protein